MSKKVAGRGELTEGAKAPADATSERRESALNFMVLTRNGMDK
jgi:hypothetical protein